MKKDRTEQQKELLNLLSRSSEGKDLETLMRELLIPVTKRTLQRRLKELVDTGNIDKTGKASATKYRIKNIAVVTEEVAEVASDYESFIPLAPQSREIIAYVRQPKQGRHPTNYERFFLEDYVPNQTYYLDESTRIHLSRIGDTGGREQPVGTYGRAILDRLLIDLSWYSSKLEGNGYTRLDTERLIQEGQEAEGKGAQDAQMILNHKRAIELIVDDAEETGFNRFSFLNLHGLLSENLLTDQTACGRLRMRRVDIAGSVYKPCDIPQTIEEMFHLLLLKAEKITDPFEQALFILIHIPYLQPFEDVNKRVSRIGSNISFIKYNLCPLTFVDMPERAYVEALLGVYEMNRVELFRDVFVWAYEQSTKKYIQVKNSLEEPDETRLKYRNELHEIVGKVIREKIYPYEEKVNEMALNMDIKENEQEQFIAMVLDDIKRIHEGVLVRYRLKMTELNDWKSLIRARMVR